MAAKISRLRIYYSDGREVEVKVKPRAQVETERHVGGDWQTMAILSVYYMAWSSVRLTDKTTPDFETWLDTIEDVEQLDGDDAPNPTEETPSPDSSSD
jgi:hypothetical protein